VSDHSNPGKTKLPDYENTYGNAIEYASCTKQLEIFLEKFAKHSYRDMVLKPNSDNSKRNIRSKDFWRGSYLSTLPIFIFYARNLPANCIYSERIEAFLSVCNDYSFPENDQNIAEFCRNPDKYFLFARCKISYNEMRIIINGFFRDLYEKLRDPKTKRKILDRERAVKKNYKECVRQIDKLFSKYARLVVLRIDFGYKKGQNVNIEDLVKDIDHIHKNKRHNKLFDHLVGYINKIEFGLDKGMHAHALLFYDGSKRRPDSDIYFAKEIGEYWVNQITNGRGVYWNRNAEKPKFERNNRLGIGDIHVSDNVKIQNLYGIAEYFCKSEQYRKPRTHKKMKLLRKSFSKEVGKKRGAPRNPRTLRATQDSITGEDKLLIHASDKKAA
jgi:hypothetical protein